MTASHSSMASYLSNRTRTPQASLPSDPSPIDSALGRDCHTADVCAPHLARRESQQTFQTFLTYASTVTADLPDDDEDEIMPSNRPAMFLPDNLVAASPKDFAELFPSARKLLIKHDDTTIDGNMNLRIDTSVKTISGQLKDMTLFHLRMHDLKRREFSIRRYCRDSGREVCHSSRKPEQPACPKAKSSGTFSSAFRKLGSSPRSPRTHSDGLRRQDSGYSSLDGNNNDLSEKGSVTSSDDPSLPLSNDLSLEFSNYARFRLGFNGARDDKRYNFEYYGLGYAWERVVEPAPTAEGVATSYYLQRLWDRVILAQITPMELTADEARTEARKGGWVPPSVLCLTDRSVADGPADVADVVVVTGLMALTDDTIRRRFEAQPEIQRQQGPQQPHVRSGPQSLRKDSMWSFASKLSCL
jgi:hypothetical protein